MTQAEDKLVHKAVSTYSAADSLDSRVIWVVGNEVIEIELADLFLASSTSHLRRASG